MPSAADALARAWRRAAEDFVGDDPGRSVTLSGGSTRVSIAGDAPRPGASVLKLALAIAAFESDAGTLEASVAVEDLPDSRWPSIVDAFDPGRELTLAELAGVMLVTSDNRSAEQLAAVLGPARINATLRAHGCATTRYVAGFGDDLLNDRGRVNIATTDECAELLAVIHRDERLRPIRTSLCANVNHTRIQLRLPDEVFVAHKTGSLRGVVNDVGVIHAETGPLTVCFLTDQQSDPAAAAADIGECALRAYTAWTEVAC